MGLFSKLLGNTATNATFTPQNEQEAWVAVMYGCIAADGDVSEAETDKLVRLFVFKSFFKGHDVIAYYKRVSLFHKQTDSQTLINSSAHQIAGENRPTVFALLMELLLSDGTLGKKEEEIIEYVSAAFALDETLASKIVEVMMIKNKGNLVF